MFICRTIFWAIFKPRNMKTLLYRFSTIAMVCYYYIMVEKIDYKDRVPNEIYLLTFVLFWHFIAMNFKIVEKNRLKKNEAFHPAIKFWITTLSVFTIGTFIIYPILAACNVSFATLPTNYVGSRYTIMFFYIVFNILICALPLFNNFMFFISDGILLS